MHLLDFIIIAVYLLAIVAIGGLFKRRQTRHEFMLAGNSMGWVVVGLSVMATLFSSNSFVFYPSAAFGNSLRIGLSLVAFLLMTPIVVWVFIPVYARLNVSTAYEYLELRFHVTVRVLASGLFVLLRIGWMASATYAASLVVASVLGVSQTSVILILGAVSVGYTMLGGLRAVMWTDVVQFGVFATTIIATLWIVVSQGQMTGSQVLQDYFDGRSGLVFDFTPSLTLEYGSWAILLGVFLEGLSAFGVDQVAVQRYLSARSERASQRGVWLNLAAMWIVLPGLLLIGVALYAYFARHPSELGGDSLTQVLAANPKIADGALPRFVRLHFPPGLMGLFLAALMAAIMSSIDSGIHSVSTALIVDFRDRLLPAWRPSTEEGELKWLRALVLVIGVLAIALACFVDPLGDVFDIGKKLTAAFGAPLLAIFVLALFSRRVTTAGVTLSVTAATGLTLYAMSTQDWFSVWYWPFGFFTALALGLVCSLFHRSNESNYTFREILKKHRSGL